MMIVFWGITPLLGAIFATSTISRTQRLTTATSAALVPIGDQVSKLTTGFMNSAYCTLWLGQALPGFTTLEGALSPFLITSQTRNLSAKNETWLSETDMYSTSLSCTQATVEDSELGYTFDNRKGCHTSAIQIPSDGEFSALYIGYYDDPNVDWSLSLLGCNTDASHSFLAIWTHNEGPNISNMTALFCEPAYWVQAVNATVSYSGSNVVDVLPVDSKSRMSPDIFNISNFEYIIGVGALFDMNKKGDIPDTAIVQQGPRLEGMSIAGPVTNMVGFAVGASRLPAIQYLDPGKLVASFENAHKILFAMAITSLFTSVPPNAIGKSGTARFQVDAIVVIRVLAILVETFFVLIACCACALLYLTGARISQLRRDPASLADVLRLASYACENDTIGIGRNRKSLDPNKWYLWAVARGSRIRHLENVQGQIHPQAAYRTSPVPSKVSTNIRPFELSLGVASIFLTILLLALITLIVVQKEIQRNIGLPLPSDNDVVNQLVLNYIPILFATFLEPFWVLLNRLLCVLRPFEELRCGQATASQSLDLKYTSLPPPLVIWRALRARHFLLASVCATALSANGLAIALSGLFETTTIDLAIDGISSTRHLSTINASAIETIGDIGRGSFGSGGYYDHFYIANSNISNQTHLPPWVSSEYYFLPVDLQAPHNDVGLVKSYNVNTTGFGVDIKCAQLNTAESNTTASLDFQAVGDVLSATWTVSLTKRAAYSRNITYSLPDTMQDINLDSGATAMGALEVVTPVDVSGEEATGLNTEHDRDLLLGGWIRANITMVPFDAQEPVKNRLTVNSLNSTWIACRPHCFMAPFEVDVDSSGRVLRATRAGSDHTALSFSPPQNGIQHNFTQKINSLLGPRSTGSEELHNDTYASAWVPFLVKVLANSSNSVDPQSPVPDFTLIGPLMEDIYRRSFAIILALHPGLFLHVNEPRMMLAKLTITPIRVFMSRPMWYVSTTLLSLNVAVAALYYWKRPNRILRKMPTTVANILELFEGSGLLREDVFAEDWRYGYGRYIGTDGTPRIGIERRPFVICLDK